MYPCGGHTEAINYGDQQQSESLDKLLSHQPCLERSAQKRRLQPTDTAHGYVRLYIFVHDF